MFYIIGIAVLGLGALPLLYTLYKTEGASKKKYGRRLRGSIYVLALAVSIVLGFQVFAGFYIDYLWFDNLGFNERFLIELQYQVLLFTAGAAISFIVFYLIGQVIGSVFPVKEIRLAVFPISLLLSLVIGASASGLWEQFLLYYNQAPSDTTDPIFHQTVGFYLFTLPFLDGLIGWLFSVLLLGVIGGGIGAIVSAGLAAREDGDHSPDRKRSTATGPLIRLLLALLAALLLLWALDTALNVYRLLNSSSGVVHGPGYVDVKLRLWAYLATAALFALSAALLAVSCFSPSLGAKLLGIEIGADRNRALLTARIFTLPLSLLAAWLVLNVVAPAVVASLIVQPNEITLERPYLKHNIDFTRRAFGLTEARIDEQRVDVGKSISKAVVEANQDILDNVRLWDPRALKDNLKEKQEIRLYYEFFDVDVDRYHLNGDYRQVMLSVRELEKRDLDIKSKTFVSQKLKYTHGYGIVLLPAHDFLPQGRPNLLIRGIPPEATVASLEIRQPAIYYGERTLDHVYVNTSEKEFDYPSGEENMYTTYDGKGGVPIDSIFRKLLFSWLNDGFRLFFSGYVDRGSRILFRRNIKQRLATVAPFLKLDRDPYAVITDDGRIKYIIDAYTVSDRYPYSAPYHGTLSDFNGINYIRNSVKAVIDAYDGTLTLYIMDESDVLIQTYAKIFPEMFTDKAAMPADIRRHIRYPEDYLHVQAKMYSTYHMTDVDVFYQREDVWEFATERYRGNFQRVNPYYMMMRFPGERELEFILMVPFTPKNKNVVNAWMAARCDGEAYGKIIVYKLPKGVEVLGPRQIEARIDQDAEMSRALSLWSQRDSEVIRGNLLAVPLFYKEVLHFLYVEPIFLQAENAPLPEIKRIVVADDERVVWADQFDAALERLTGTAETDIAEEPSKYGDRAQTGRGAGIPSAVLRAPIAAFEGYKRAMGREAFQEAGEHLVDLNEGLEQLRPYVDGGVDAPEGGQDTAP